VSFASYPHASLKPFKIRNVKCHDETNQVISMTVYQR